MSEVLIPLDQATRAYHKVKSAITALEAEYEAKLLALKNQQEQIRAYMKTELQKLGVKSLKTKEGNIILSEKTRYWTTDWDSFKQFVLEKELPDLFEKRIAQGNMAQWLRDHPTEVPAGLCSDSSVEVSVRKV